MEEENRTYNFSPPHPFPCAGVGLLEQSSALLQREPLTRAEAAPSGGGVIDGRAKGWTPLASTVPPLKVLCLGGSSGHAKLSTVGRAAVHFLHGATEQRHSTQGADFHLPVGSN